MFWLPKELQDYIYSYDDNAYYNRIFGQSLSHIIHLYKRKQYILSITRIHYQYQIYIDKYTPYYRGTMIPRAKLSLKQYIVDRNRIYEPPVWCIKDMIVHKRSSHSNNLPILEG